MNYEDKSHVSVQLNMFFLIHDKFLDNRYTEN